jgi:hypothetical protein
LDDPAPSASKITLKYVWNQSRIPVVLRRTGRGQKIRVRLPFSSNNGEWLRNDRRNSPDWISKDKYWELPKSWFNDFVERSLVKYGKIYIIQPFRAQEICAPACQNAAGHECECSCMGRYHGAGNDGSWFDVSDTFATRSGAEQLACRLMTSR